MIAEGAILAFGTDLNGAYGNCMGISLRWWIGEGCAPERTRDAMRHVPDRIASQREQLLTGAVIEAGRTVCVEALVSPEGGNASIKVEDDAPVMESGCKTPTRHPFGPRPT